MTGLEKDAFWKLKECRGQKVVVRLSKRRPKYRFRGHFVVAWMQNQMSVPKKGFGKMGRFRSRPAEMTTFDNLPAQQGFASRKKFSDGAKKFLDKRRHTKSEHRVDWLSDRHRVDDAPRTFCSQIRRRQLANSPQHSSGEFTEDTLSGDYPESCRRLSTFSLGRKSTAFRQRRERSASGRLRSIGSSACC